VKAIIEFVEEFLPISFNHLIFFENILPVDLRFLPLANCVQIQILWSSMRRRI